MPTLDTFAEINECFSIIYLFLDLFFGGVLPLRPSYSHWHTMRFLFHSSLSCVRLHRCFMLPFVTSFVVFLFWFSFWFRNVENHHRRHTQIGTHTVNSFLRTRKNTHQRVKHMRTKYTFSQLTSVWNGSARENCWAIRSYYNLAHTISIRSFSGEEISRFITFSWNNPRKFLTINLITFSRFQIFFLLRKSANDPFCVCSKRRTPPCE